MGAHVMGRMGISTSDKMVVPLNLSLLHNAVDDIRLSARERHPHIGAPYGAFMLPPLTDHGMLEWTH